MIPREPSDVEAASRGGLVVAIGGPSEGDGVVPCPAVIVEAAARVYVAYSLNELEVSALAQGGTVWLETWGMIPVHRMVVVTAAGDEVPDGR